MFKPPARPLLGVENPKEHVSTASSILEHKYQVNMCLMSMCYANSMMTIYGVAHMWNMGKWLKIGKFLNWLIERVPEEHGQYDGPYDVT